MGRMASFLVRFPIHSDNWIVLDSNSNTEIKSQIVTIPETVKAIPGRHSQYFDLNFEIFFEISELPALSQAKFTLHKKLVEEDFDVVIETNPGNDIVIDLELVNNVEDIKSKPRHSGPENLKSPGRKKLLKSTKSISQFF